MSSGATIVGSVVYDATIDIAGLKKSIADADKLVQKSYTDQTSAAKKASKEITNTSSKDAQARVDAITKEAQQTANVLSNYTPQIQKQFLTVERANNQVASATARAQNAIQKYGVESYQASKASDTLKVAVQNQAQQQSRLQSMLDGSSSKTNGFSAAMTKAGAVAGATASILLAVLDRAITKITDSFNAAISRIDTLNNAPKVLQNLGFSAEDSANATQRLDKGIRGLPTALDSATSALLAIASASGKSLDYATDLTLAFNNMALAGGKGPAEAQRALTQFTQALGRGKFQMQDFNTLAEVMPAQLNQVAKALLGSEANTRTLGTALSDGTLTIDQFNDEIIKLNKKGGSNFASFESQAKDATKGINTSITNMQTAITRGVASIVNALGSEEISGFATGAGKAFEQTLNDIAVGIKFLNDAIALTIEWLQPLINYINSNQKAIEVLKTTFVVLGAILAGAVIAAVGGVIAIIAILSGIIETLVDIVENLMLAFIAAWNGIVAAWNGAVAFFTGVVNGIKSAFTSLISFFSGLWSTIISMFRNVGVAIGDAIGGAFKGVMNGVIGFVESTVNGIARSINGVAKGIDDVLPGDQSKFRVQEVRLPRFASGGFTGRGGKYEPAGIVHAGEYVLPKEQVNQDTGMPDWSKIGGNTTNLSLNLAGLVFNTKSDKRAFASEIAKLINESSKSKIGKISIEGI